MLEFLRFCIVGALTFFIDYGLLYFLTESFNFNYLISSAMSFSLAVVVNYVLCQVFVFNNAQNGFKQVVIFVITSFIGLFLNQLVMWIFVEILLLHYMIAKIGVAGIVMIWNFVTKKMALKGSW